MRRCFAPAGRHRFVHKLFIALALITLAATTKANESAAALALPLGISGGVVALSFSPNGNLLFAVDFDGSVIVWRVQDRAQLRKFTPKMLAPHQRAFVLDNGSVVMLEDTNTVVQRSLGSGEVERTFRSSQALLEFAFSDRGGVATVEARGVVRIWNPATALPSDPLPIGCPGIQSLDFSKDGRYLALLCITPHPSAELMSSTTLDVRLWNIATQSLEWIENLPGEVSVDVAAVLRPGYEPPKFRDVIRFSEDQNSSYVYVGGNNASIFQVAETSAMRSIPPQIEERIFGNRAVLQSVKLAPGILLLGAAISSVWDRSTGSRLTIEGAPQMTGPVAVPPGGGHLFYANAVQKSIDVFEPGVQTWQAPFETTVFPIRHLAVCPNGSRLVVSSGASLRIWDLDAGREIQRLLDRNFYMDVSLTDDCTHAVVRVLGATENSVLVRRIVLSTGRIEKAYSIPESALINDMFAFSRNGDFFISGRRDQSYAVYDSRSAKPLGAVLERGPMFPRAVAISDDGSLVFAAGTSIQDDQLVSHGVLWDRRTGEKKLVEVDSTFADWTFSPDGRYLVAVQRSGRLLVLSTSTGTRETIQTPGRGVLLDDSHVIFSAKGHTALASFGNSAFVVDLDLLSCSPVSYTQPTVVTGLGYLPDQNFVFTAGQDGTVRAWDLQGDELVALVGMDDMRQWDGAFGAPFQPKGLPALPVTGRTRWLAFDPQGRFDTMNFDDTRDVHWVSRSQPLDPLPLEALVKSNFEPNLVGRKLSRQPMKSPRSISFPSSPRPEVRIENVSFDARSKRTISVRVKVRALRDNNGISGGFRDLRIFRNGQMVREVFFPGEVNSNGFPLVGSHDCQIAAGADESYVTCGRIALPSGRGISNESDMSRGSSAILFTAYAFNRDDIKSDTFLYRFTDDRASLRASPKRKAYIVSIGVNANETCTLNLQNIARETDEASALLAAEIAKTRAFNEVVPIVLVSDYVGRCRSEGYRVIRDDATKENVKAVLGTLAGSVNGTRPRWTCGANSERRCPKLKAIGPDDLLLIIFSGHGDTDASGSFYLVPSDTGAVSTVLDSSGRIHKDVLDRSISSMEFRSWIREIDAGSLAVIINACRSAASIESGDFKPAPLGSHDLGELAYAKGMRVLAGSESLGAAIDSPALKYTLVMYAIIKDAIQGRAADTPESEGQLTLSALLRFVAQDVPLLYKKYVNAGDVQYPRVFDFVLSGDDPIISVGAPVPGLTRPAPPRQ